MMGRMEFILWFCGSSIDDPAIAIAQNITTSLSDTVEMLSLRPFLDRVIKNGNALLLRNADEFEQRLTPDLLLHITFRRFLSAFETGNTSYYNSKKMKNNNIYFVESKFSSMELVYTNYMETTGVILMKMDWNNLRQWHCKPHVTSMVLSENERDFLDTWKLRNVHIKAIILILNQLAQDAIQTLNHDQKDIVITTLYAYYLGIK